MDAPNDELKGLAGQALPALQLEDKVEIVVEWLNLFLGLPIAKNPIVAMSDHTFTELLANLPGLADDGNALVWFSVNIDPTGTEYLPLMVNVNRDGTAFINPGAEIREDLGSGTYFTPSFLEGKGIMDFKGSWEQVLRKLIELNDLVSKQIPEVPADLKQS